MGDVVSTELVLDADTEAAVRADWERLAAAGLSSLAAYRSDSNRPHVTLLVRPALAPHPFDAVAERLPIEMALGAPIVFAHGDRGVLARPVLPSPDLEAVHRAVHASVPPGEDAAHTAPGEWTPHVTLCRRLRLVDLDRALALLGPQVRGQAVALRRWDSAARRVTDLAELDDDQPGVATAIAVL